MQWSLVCQGHPPQTIRVTFQSRKSNIEAAQISFLAQRRFRYCRKRPDKKLMLVRRGLKSILNVKHCVKLCFQEINNYS